MAKKEPKQRSLSVEMLHTIARQKLETPGGMSKVALYAAHYCKERLNYVEGDEIPMPRHLVEVMKWTLEAASRELCEQSLEQPPASSS